MTPVVLDTGVWVAGIRLREVAEAAKLKLGAQGNLIEAAYAGRPNAPGATNRLRAAARRSGYGDTTR